MYKCVCVCVCACVCVRVCVSDEWLITNKSNHIWQEILLEEACYYNVSVSVHVCVYNIASNLILMILEGVTIHYTIKLETL